MFTEKSTNKDKTEFLRIILIVANAVLLNFHFIYSQTDPKISNAEITFTEHSVDEDFGGASGIAVWDVDKDEAPDIICASEYAQGTGAEGIAWWKNNKDGTWTRNNIDQTMYNIMSLRIADINNDGNMDILVSDWGIADEITYFSSDGEIPPNWTKNIINSNFTYAHDACAADINNDGYVDVAGASAGGQVKLWYQTENKTWTEQVIDNDFVGGRAICVVDIDQDTDLDIIAASLDDTRKTVLYLNDGEDPIGWTTQLIDNECGGHHIYSFDFDNDQDIDILISAPDVDEIILWKNNGTIPPTFEKVIVAEFESACRALPCDFDQDGDYDILCSGILSNKLSVWFNNGGSPNTWSEMLICDELDRMWPSFIYDMDDDGDFDFVAGASGSGVIGWWENDLFSGISVSDVSSDDINVYPNPACQTIIISVNMKVLKPFTLNLYDIQGRCLKSLSVNSEKTLIDISDLQNATYFLYTDLEGRSIVKKFINNR